MPGWAKPGTMSNSGRWRYDLRRGFVPPGHAADKDGTQYELGDGFDPGQTPQGFHVLTSPKGTAAPIDAINYTPETGEVHDVDALAPVDKVNYSLVPDHRLRRMAAARGPSSAMVGAGHEEQQSTAAAPSAPQFYPGTPPINMGRFSMGAGQEEDDSGDLPDDATDPTAGAAAAPPADAAPTTGGSQAEGPPFAGRWQIDSSHVAEYQGGKVVGVWTLKPNGLPTDPTAWSFERAPAAASTGAVTFGDLQVHPDGSWTQTDSRGQVHQVRGPTPTRNAQVTWGNPVQNEDGSITQTSSTGEVRTVRAAQRQSAAEQHWTDLPPQEDGSIWQRNDSTGALKLVQGPVKGTDTPITVGNRLVKYNPEKKQYEEVYKAPAGYDLQKVGNQVIAINQDDPNQHQVIYTDEQGVRKSEADIHRSEVDTKQAEENLIPGVTLSGGNIVAAPGAAVDIQDYDPRTKSSSARTLGTRYTPDELLTSYGMPARTSTSPSTTSGPPAKDRSPDVVYDTPPTGGTLQPGQAGTAADPISPRPPQPFEQSDIHEGTRRMPLDQPEDDMGAGAESRSQKLKSSLGTDLQRDVPRWKSRKKKNLGIQFFGKGLDEFSPFVGVGQDADPTNPVADSAGGLDPAQPGSSPSPSAGVGSSPPTPAGGLPTGNVDPKLIALVLAMLMKKMGGGQPGAAQPPQMPGMPGMPTPPGPSSAGGGMGGGMPDMPGAGQDYAEDPGMPGYSVDWTKRQATGLNRSRLGGTSGGTQYGGRGWDAPEDAAPLGPIRLDPMEAFGAGAEAPQRGRWVPPVDPQQVLGTGHKYGDAMAMGEPTHHGVDLQAPKGTPVRAPVDGTLHVEQNPNGLGLAAIVISPDGKQHKLGHLSAIHAQNGAQVKAGQVIGAVGDTGLTTGANLHYAEQKGGRHFDPSKKMGVIASLPPAPGTQMMTQDSQPGAGQDEGYMAEEYGPKIRWDQVGDPMGGSRDAVTGDRSSADWQEMAGQNPTKPDVIRGMVEESPNYGPGSVARRPDMQNAWALPIPWEAILDKFMQGSGLPDWRGKKGMPPPGAGQEDGHREDTPTGDLPPTDVYKTDTWRGRIPFNEKFTKPLNDDSLPLPGPFSWHSYDRRPPPEAPDERYPIQTRDDDTTPPYEPLYLPNFRPHTPDHIEVGSGAEDNWMGKGGWSEDYPSPFDMPRVEPGGGPLGVPADDISTRPSGGSSEPNSSDMYPQNTGRDPRAVFRAQGEPLRPYNAGDLPGMGDIANSLALPIPWEAILDKFMQGSGIPDWRRKGTTPPGAGAEGGVGAGAQYTVPINGPNGPGFITVNAGSPEAAKDNASQGGNYATGDPTAGGHMAHEENGVAVSGSGPNNPGNPANKPSPNTTIGIDPAKKAELDQNQQRLDQERQNELDRHDEALAGIKQQAQNEADWRSVQDALNQENARHNKAMEGLQVQQMQNDVLLEKMREQAQMSQQIETQLFQRGQEARGNAMNILNSALNNPWIQALTKLGVNPGGPSGSINPLNDLLTQILGGATSSAVMDPTGIPKTSLPATPTAQQWSTMSPAQKAAFRAQVMATGPGAWEQFQTNFQNKSGTGGLAPDQTQLQAALQSPVDQVGTQMNAEMFGEGAQPFQQRQQRQWSGANAPNVMQSLLAGTGWG